VLLRCVCGCFCGDSFRRLPLVFGSISVIATSCLKFWVALVSRVRVLRAELFSLLIDICITTIHVVCFTCCVLDSDGPVTFASRSGVSVWLLSCLAGYGVSLVD